MSTLTQMQDVQKRMLRLALVLCIVIQFAPLQSKAAVSLRVTPAILSLEAEPGATGEQPIAISNEGTEAVEIVTGVEPYQGATGMYSAVDWIKVEPATFTLNAGESREAMVQIEVPDDLDAGGRYALVTFTSGGGGGDEGSGASVAAKLGAAILLVVDGKGDLTESAELAGFGPVLEPDGRVGFRALLSNSGNVHLRPSGGVEILGADGVPYGSLEIPEERTVLPGNEALLSAVGSLPVDENATYTASAEIHFGEDGVATGEVSFAPTVDLSIASVSVCENLDRGPTLTATLQNDGGLGLTPNTRFVVLSAGGNLIGDASALQTNPVWGGTTAEMAADFSERLVTGDYVLAVQVQLVSPSGNGESIVPPLEYEQPFSIGGLGGNAAPLCETSESG